MTQNNKNLTVLTPAERAAYYDVPDFNEEQHYEFLTLSQSELDLVISRNSWSTRVYCCLQMAYFKSVNLFFKVNWSEINHKTIAFIFEQYFFDQNIKLVKITDYEHYTQCTAITEFYGFKSWQSSFSDVLLEKACELIKLNINPQFIALELLNYLKQQRIMRPQYTTLQSIVITTINSEKSRINKLLNEQISSEECKLILTLISNDSTLSQLSAIKQDAKDFKPRMLLQECRKLDVMQQIYLLAQRILPSLAISKNNIANYGALIHFYSAHDLRERITAEQSYLYILCYIHHRFQLIADNLVIALCYHQRHAAEKVSEIKKLAIATYAIAQNTNMNHMKQLVKFYVDESLADDLYFGEIRQKAFTVLDKQAIIKYITDNPESSDETLHWQSVDQLGVTREFGNYCTLRNYPILS